MWLLLFLPRFRCSCYKEVHGSVSLINPYELNTRVRETNYLEFELFVFAVRRIKGLKHVFGREKKNNTKNHFVLAKKTTYMRSMYYSSSISAKGSVHSHSSCCFSFSFAYVCKRYYPPAPPRFALPPPATRRNPSHLGRAERFLGVRGSPSRGGGHGRNRRKRKPQIHACRSAHHRGQRTPSVKR